MKRIRSIQDSYSASAVGYVTAQDVISAAELNAEPSFPVTDEARVLLQRAQNCHNALRDIVKRRQRSRRYYRGEQWSDTVEVHINGTTTRMTEEEYIQSQGKPALKQNLIRPPVRNIIGQYRSNPYKSVIYPRNKKDKKAGEMMSVALESAYEMNSGKERDARMLEEFLVSGFPIYETSYSWDITRQKPIPKFRKVDVARFFVNPNVADVEGDDVDIIGEIVDIPLDEVVSMYASNEAEEKELRNLYGNKKDMDADRYALSSNYLDSLSFGSPATLDTCRIIKVCVLEGKWYLDAHDYADGTRTIYEYGKRDMLLEENRQRAELEAATGVKIPRIKFRKKFVREWVYYHLTPYGNVLFKKKCPYKHKNHPYVFLMYPLLDGEVWSLVEDLIDQQRAINRMIILQDFIIGAAAKGVLLVPEECIADDFDLEDIADEWARYNGVIKIKAKKGAEMPKQLMASNFNIGINDAINYQMKWIQDIGGVQDAAMGARPSSGTSAARYKAETANSSLNALDYIESFGDFLIKRDWKIVQIIKQYYTEPQYIALAGSEYSDEAHNYDPEAIRDMDFDNTMAKMNDNITLRFVSEDSLAKLLEMGLINLKQYLKASETMYSDKLMQIIEEAEQEAAAGNVNQEQLSQLAQRVSQENGASSPQGLNNVRGLFNGSVL